MKKKDTIVLSPKPRATYRLQLNCHFGFEEAAQMIKYLGDLGISHVYTSPFLQAVKGSSHGYDVVDHSQINSELGGETAYKKFLEGLKTNTLGLMIDLVPNHMAIIGNQNPWWWDILENGPASHYAFFFDVDWEASNEKRHNKVLLPVLEDHYGKVLEKKELFLSFKEGKVILNYQDHSFPIDPSSLAKIFNKVAKKCRCEKLAFLAESYARLPKTDVVLRQALEFRHRDKKILSELLVQLCREKKEVLKTILLEIDHLNQDVESLDALIEQQNYRLAYWKVANRDLGYRRFFDIKDLIGLRIEDLEVFKAAHELPAAWVKKGWVNGIRVDHPDGLRNPTEYFHRLAKACPKTWIIAEKILEPGEKIPNDWKVAGTTGYDFLNLLSQLFTDPAGEAKLTEVYKKFSKVEEDFSTIVYRCKLQVLKELFGSEITLLTNLFAKICEKDRRHRDYTSVELQEALSKTAACFPVYRSYVYPPEHVTNSDKQFIESAIEHASKKKSDLDSELFSYLKQILLLQKKGKLETELAMRFQQLTGPVMAKGFEDTALYRYHRLISLNEVGGDPNCFGISLEKFHENCQLAQKMHPLSLLASTTHDTKHSEDVRSRLELLSEIPEKFEEALLRWSELNKGYHTNNLPEPNTEYLFYQILIGAWPISQERIVAYMEKAVREAKVHTFWTNPNTEYEETLRSFILQVLQNKLFIEDLEKFIAPLIFPGRINSLAQTLIKLTAPGIPDFYQGSELWNLSLVDPDNRQPVDFQLRKNLLNEIKTLSLEAILNRMDEGLPKLWLIWKILQFRKKRADIFELEYRPWYAQGKFAEHIVAFMRGEESMTITPRFFLKLTDWNNTMLELPEGMWIDLFTEENFQGIVPISELIKRFPIAFLFKK